MSPDGGCQEQSDVEQTFRAGGESSQREAALWQILKPKRRWARLILDGQVFEDDFLFVLACNTRFTGAAMRVAPRADMADGKVDVVVLRNASRFQMLRLFRGIFDGSYESLGYTEHHQVRLFAIIPAGRQWLDLDGELKGTTPVQVEVMPAALRVFAGLQPAFPA